MSEDNPVYQVITANKLLGGEIVWLTNTGWAEAIAEAKIFEEAEIGTALEAAQASEAENEVVGVYAVEVTAGREPLSAREKVRAKGPSVAYGEDAYPGAEFQI